MIAVDTNILVYAHRRDSRFNERAFEVLGELQSGSAPWGIPWPCLFEFLAIVTHPRVYRPPSTMDQGVDQIDAWLETPTAHLLAESATGWAAARSLLVTSRVVGPQVHDAKIAALCTAHGIRELWTADRDFSRFPQLRTRNPLLAA